MLAISSTLPCLRLPISTTALDLPFGRREQYLLVTECTRMYRIRVKALTVKKQHRLLLQQGADVVDDVGRNPPVLATVLCIWDDAGYQLLHVLIRLRDKTTTRTKPEGRIRDSDCGGSEEWRRARVENRWTALRPSA